MCGGQVGKLNKLLRVDRAGVRAPFYLRLGTTDIPTFDQIFLRKDYAFDFFGEPEVIVDAGANIGLTSVFFANKYPNARIIALEPDLGNFELLQKNVSPYPNIVPVLAALWDKNEEITLVDPGLGEWGFMTKETGGSAEMIQGDFVCMVKGVTIDALMHTYDLARINILKMDIEGAEREVFADSSLWIERVDSIIIELHERMKAGCNRSFYNGSDGFVCEWQQGESIYLSREQCLKRCLF